MAHIIEQKKNFRKTKRPLRAFASLREPHSKAGAPTNAFDNLARRREDAKGVFGKARPAWVPLVALGEPIEYQEWFTQSHQRTQRKDHAPSWGSVPVYSIENTEGKGHRSSGIVNLDSFAGEPS